MFDKIFEFFSTLTVTWEQIVTILTASGAVGGLGYHLVIHKGTLELPQLTWKPSHKIHCGCMSDILIGIIAANSINVGLSGIIDYSKGSWHDAKLTTTLISFGILAGFSGGPILQALSKKVMDSLGAKLDELTKDQQALGQRTDTLVSRATQHIIDDTLQYRHDPSPFDLQLIEERSADLNAKPVGELTAHDWLVLGYRAHEEKRHSEAIENLLKAIKLRLPKELLWTAYNLLGLSYHYKITSGITPGWNANAENAYNTAIEHATFSQQITVTTVNLGYVYLDMHDYQKAYDIANQAMKFSLLEDVSFSQIKYIALLLHAAAAIELGKTDEASVSLNKITFPNSVNFLFVDKSISKDIAKLLAGIPDLPSTWQTLLAKYQ